MKKCMYCGSPVSDEIPVFMRFMSIEEIERFQAVRKLDACAVCKNEIAFAGLSLAGIE